MSDNIPFEIQMEIIKIVSDVKSLIQFRSVSKPWKSFIDSSEFIKGYGARHTQPSSFILSCRPDFEEPELRYIRLVEDDDKNKTYKVQQQELDPLIKQFSSTQFVGACHGLLCLICYNKDNDRKMLVIWNPFIQKSFGIALPDYEYEPHSQAYWTRLVFGFGVCPVTRDPTVVKILQTHKKPWHVEVFTLSSGVWNVIPASNLLRQSIQLKLRSPHVVIDRFIKWTACDTTSANDKYMVVSFDLITKEFKLVDAPNTLTNRHYRRVCVSKLRESLVVYESIYVDGGKCCVWVMEHDLTFRKLYTIDALVDKILGFRESGEPIFETLKKEDGWFNTLDVYNPCSEEIKNLGVDGVPNSFSMGCYNESLLLLDHSGFVELYTCCTLSDLERSSTRGSLVVPM